MCVPVVLIFGLNENRTMFQTMIELQTVKKVFTNYFFFRKLINILYMERMLMCPLEGYTWAL